MRWRSSTMRFWAIVRQQAGRSSRSFLGNVANQLNLRLDQTVLAGLANPRQLGLYAVAVSIAEVPGIGTSAFRQVLLPEAASRQDEGLLVARASRTVLLVTAPIIVVGLVAVGPFLGLVFGPGFADGKNMARILLVASWVGTPGGFLTTGILASGRPGLASVPAVAGLVCTGFLLPVLATRHGGIGAAWTSLAAYTAATLVSALLFRRITGHSLAAALVPRPGDARSVAGAVAARVRAARRARGAVSRSPL
jgi:O-antigen/teichoic acid export membrane protein